MRKLLPATIGLACLLFICGTAFCQSAETTKVIQTRVHIVQKGQLSIDIAKKYGLDLNKLKQLNPGRNLARLQIGDRIIVGVMPVQSQKPNAGIASKPTSIAKKAARQDKIALMREHENGSDSEKKSESSAFGTVISTIVKLIVVLALAYFTILALKLLSDKRDASPRIRRDMKLIDTVKLTNASNLHLVEVGGKRLLIGSSTGQVNLLAEIDQDESEEPAPVQENKFADYLARYSSGQNVSNTPAGRIAGLLRDCASYLQDRKRGLPKSINKKSGDSDEA